jgi:deoxyribose-phosphate aldolase
MSRVLDAPTTDLRARADADATALVRAWVGRDGSPRGLVDRVGGVDEVGVTERVAALRTRSIKKASKVWALEMAIRMMDLTTLEGKDTPGKVRGLCAKAIRPDPGDPAVPSVAAVCVYPALVPVAKTALAGTGIHVASVATGFPSGQTFTDIKLVAVKAASGPAHLKVILETGELETYDNVRRASILAMAAGADFIKTSTGKVAPAATLPVTLVMLEAIRDFHRRTGRIVGMKPAGGIRTAKESIQYLVVLYETLGPRWMTPDLFRFGASSLLNDVIQQLHKERTGRYDGPDYVTLD